MKNGKKARRGKGAKGIVYTICAGAKFAFTQAPKAVSCLYVVRLS